MIIGIIGHFINEDGRHRQVVFGLCEIVNEYTNENMAGVFIDLFRDYGIANNIGYFMADNAKSNNMCIDAFFYVLYLNILTKLYKRCQLHCFNYIINFCV